MIVPHAEATVIWLANRSPTKRRVTFIVRRYQAERRQHTVDDNFSTEVIDPANARSVKITAKKMYDPRMLLNSFHYTGLPVYLDYVILPKNAIMDEFRGIYCPGTNAAWFEGADFKRLPHGHLLPLLVSPVEMEQRRPAHDVRRLVEPFDLSIPPHAQMQAIEEHEQAIASSVVLAYQHQWNEAAENAHVLEGVVWREEGLNLVMEYSTNLPWEELTDENRKTLTKLAKTYTSGMQVTLQKGTILRITDDKTGTESTKFEAERSAVSHFSVDAVNAEESGRFEIRLMNNSTVNALQDFRCADIDELEGQPFLIRPTTSQLIPRGIASDFYEGRLSALLRKAENGESTQLEKDKAEAIKAFLGGGTYVEAEHPTAAHEAHIKTSKLNDQQQEAIRAFFDGFQAVGIQAPAGTGKTTVIIYALLVHFFMALAEEIRFRNECDRAVRHRWGAEDGPYIAPIPPQFDLWVLTSASNAAVTNMIKSALRLCGKQLKMIVLMSTTALKKLGEDVPWQAHLFPSLINSCYSDPEMWRLTTGEHQILAAAMDICANKYSFMSNMNWVTLANEERVKGSDATILNDALRIIIRQYRPMVIFGTTTLVLRHMEGLNLARTFVVDEASTSPEVAILAALYRAAAAKKTVQVGDVTQLHVFEGNLHERNKKIAFRSALKTLIERSNAPRGENPTNMRLIELKESHRFHPKICAFLEKLFYPGLRPGARSSQKTLLTNSKFPLVIKDTPMVAINIVQGQEERSVTMSFRVREHTEAVVEVVEALRVFAPRARIGIACFYNAQRDQIRAAGLEKLLVPHSAIISVDVSQGLEYDVVIIVPSRSEGLKEKEHFLDSWERLCVAFSRGGSGIILVGNLTQLQTAPNWKRLLDVFREFAPLRGNEYLDELVHLAKLEKEAQAAAAATNQPLAEVTSQDIEHEGDIQELDPPTLALEHQLEQRVSP